MARLNTLATILMLLVSLVAGGCSKPKPHVDPAANDTNAKPVAVCTVGMITDIVRNVAGDRIEVIGLLGTGIDPHLYKPTRSDVAQLLSADMIFYNGLLLEGKMTDSLVRAATSGKQVSAVTEHLDEEFLLEPEEFKGHYDPHVWMDPAAWQEAVGVVREALIKYDPEGESDYTTNARAYLDKLEELDAYCLSVLASVPEDQRVLVTAHDAFNYFGRRFGYEVVGIQGLSTESEAAVRDIERLVDLLVTRKIAAVFVESTVSERSVRALVAGAGARGHTVNIGGTLFSDAMGNAGTYEGTYIGMIDHNVTIIVRALGGEAPLKGMSGQLTP